jgi:hypothetical protein
MKEPQFFSKPFLHRFMYHQQYRALFPKEGAEQAQIHWFELDAEKHVTSTVLEISRDPNRPAITGEASANTFAQVPPARLRRVFPDAKLILCVRHPVDRAYAHYMMLTRFAEEGRRLAFPLTDFKSDFITDFQRNNGGYFAQVSLYSQRLWQWANVFGPDQIAIIRSEDLDNPIQAQEQLVGICTHLGIDHFDFSGILQQKENVSGQSIPDPALREELMSFYQEDIRALESFTGRKFDWS